MTIRTVGLALFLASVALTACSKKDEGREAEAAASEQVPSGPATLPTSDEGSGEPASGAMPSSDNASAPSADGPPQMATVVEDFDVSSVPPTSASLPPFPFFKDPEGLENDLKGTDAVKSFDRHYFIAGGKLVTQEGREALFQYNLGNSPADHHYSELEFLRNYENAVATLGGRKISSVQLTPEVIAAAGGREQIEKYWAAAAPAVPEAEQHTFLIRTADKEYWVHVSAGAIIPSMGFVVVLEKQGMKSSIGFLDAAAMKKELEAKGRVALYINFDTDKATLRPDAQPIIAEVNKLLTSDETLKLSIEGHTDNSGGAEHNRALATSRARSVLGALVGLGVDPSRLASKGFGPDKPVADNSTDEGRAKNRRVELVKIN
ncbi:MAG TPA: OmpA family protein [Steroidobacteraceae bacterium]|nr:OmpA family protein [Steroidobacteraceae bacterium]